MRIIDSKALKKHLDKEDILLIDVREPEEYRSEHIKHAFLIPLDDLSIEKLPSTSSPIVVYCHSGTRSAKACTKLLKQDPTLNVFSLEGGIVAWKNAGFNVKKSGFPLDRQTQIATGFLGFSGTMLGTFESPLFYVVPGVIGLGLMFAGITGWCGMAKLLAKMPWNR